jgi:hypothetical protein
MIFIILVHGAINIHRVSFLFHLYRNSQANRRAGLLRGISPQQTQTP